jgi:hypothetical protein
MRSPIEEHEPASGRGDQPADRPPGGKALERLHQFEAERGLTSETEEPAAESRRPADARGSAAGTTTDAAEASGPSASVMAWATALAEIDSTAAAEAGAGGPNDTAERAVPRGLALAAWRSIGPTVMRNGQTYGSGAGSRVDVSGRVAAIAVDPSNGQHLLVGAAGGGIWESHDQGATWAPRGDALAALAIGAIAFDPTAPATVYAGTGEGDFYAGLGQGVYRSTDGGTTWALLAGAPFVGVGFHRIAVDPSDHNTMFAATTAGLHTSNNSGTTWTLRRSGRCWSVSVDPSGGDTEVLAGCADGLFRSTDRGSTWAPVALGGIPSPAGISRLAVSHAPSNGGVAWAWGATNPDMAIPNGTQRTPRLWRRATAGGAFATIATDASVRTGQAWYDWHVHAAPNNDTVVYVGEIALYRVEQSGAAWTWTNLSAKSSGDSIHPDQHCLAFDPQNGDVIYAGCDGGIFRSPNRGANWADLNDGLAITEIEYLAQDIGATRWLLAGTQDNGTIRYVGRDDWDHVADGDGGDCGSNTVDPSRVYHSYFYMGLDRSGDRGATWTWTPTGSRDPTVYGQLFYPPMEACGATVAQAGESVFVSRDSGTSFTEVALPGGPVASAMFMPTGDQVYVGTSNGQIFRISWSGSAWQPPVALTSPRGAFVSDLYVDKGNPNRIWVTYSQIGGGRVYRSNDAGTIWTDCSAGVPALPVNAIEVHAGDANRVWIAADKGVYESLDAGATWATMSNGLPNCIIADLLYHPNAHLLRAGTRNRGVWQREIDRIVDPICGVQWTGSLAANQTQRWFTFNWPATWHVLWTAMPTTVRQGAPELWWDVQIERADAQYVTYWITVKNLTNQPVNFEGRYEILSYS